MKTPILFSLIITILVPSCATIKTSGGTLNRSGAKWPPSFKKEISYTNDIAQLLSRVTYQGVIDGYLKPAMKAEEVKKFESRFPAEDNRYLFYILWTKQPLKKEFNAWSFGPMVTNVKAGKTKDLYADMFDWQFEKEGQYANCYMIKLSESYQPKSGDRLSLLIKNRTKSHATTFQM